jgi:hypothetical protein
VNGAPLALGHPMPARERQALTSEVARVILKLDEPSSSLKRKSENMDPKEECDEDTEMGDTLDGPGTKMDEPEAESPERHRKKIRLEEQD